MTAAEEAMKLRVLAFAVAEAIKDADKRVEADRTATGAKSFATTYGSFGTTTRKPSAALDEAEFVRWVEDNYPGDIITTKSVRPAFRAEFEKELVVDGDMLIFPRTGEQLEWATVRPGSEYFTARLDPESKRKAAEWAHSPEIARLLEIEAI